MGHPNSLLTRGRAVMVVAVLVAAGCSSDAADDAVTTTSGSVSEDTDAEPIIDREDPDAGGASAGIDTTVVAIDPEPVRPVPSQVSSENGHWIGVVSMSASAVEVTWSEVEGADVVYQLFRFETEPSLDKENVDLDAPFVEVVDAIGYVDESVEPGGFYTYILRVIADDEVLTRRWTDVLAVDDTTPPTKIVELEASVTAEGVLLEWAPSSDDVEFGSYGVFRTDGGGEPQYIGGGGDVGQTSFLDTTVFGDGAPPDGVASYEVVAFDFHNNRSDPSVIEVTIG